VGAAQLALLSVSLAPLSTPLQLPAWTTHRTMKGDAVPGGLRWGGAKSWECHSQASCGLLCHLEGELRAHVPALVSAWPASVKDTPTLVATSPSRPG
jgi:hypothetical protein